MLCRGAPPVIADFDSPMVAVDGFSAGRVHVRRGEPFEADDPIGAYPRPRRDAAEEPWRLRHTQVDGETHS
jgi:hypothetical protein